MPAVARARAAKTKVVNGKHVSARSKTGDSQCSQAMSEWVSTRKSGTTPASVFAILGQCRAKARALKQAAMHKEAGNEAKAQRLEAIASGKKGPVTAKDRMALAQEKRAARVYDHLKAGGRVAFQKGDKTTAEASMNQGGQRAGLNQLQFHKPGSNRSVANSGIRPKQELLDWAKTSKAKVLGKPANPITAAMQGGGDGAMGGPSLRQQADSHRAAKGDPKMRAKQLFRRLETHQSKTVEKIRGDGIHSGVATDRKIGQYLEGTYGLENRLNRTIAKHSKADMAIKNRQARIDRENEMSVAEDKVKAAYRAKPTPKSIDAAMKQHDEFAAKMQGGGASAGGVPQMSLATRRQLHHDSQGKPMSAQARMDRANQLRRERELKRAKPSPASPQPAQAKAAGRGTAERMARANAIRNSLRSGQSHAGGAGPTGDRAYRVGMARAERSRNATPREAVVNTPAPTSEPWVHTGSRKSPGTGAQIYGEAGPQRQIKAPVARFTAARMERAKALRAERAAKRAPAQPAVSPRAARYNRLEAEVFQGKKDGVPYVGLNQGRGERFGDPQVAKQVEERRNTVARAKKIIRSEKAKQNTTAAPANAIQPAQGQGTFSFTPPTPSLRAQADAFRAAKGTVETRMERAKRLRQAMRADSTTTRRTVRTEAPISGSFIKDAPTLYFSGNTFNNKDAIKSFGARWDADSKSWVGRVAGNMKERSGIADQLNKLTKRGVKIEYDREIVSTKRRGGKGVKDRVNAILARS